MTSCTIRHARQGNITHPHLIAFAQILLMRMLALRLGSRNCSRTHLIRRVLGARSVPARRESFARQDGRDLVVAKLALTRRRTHPRTLPGNCRKTNDCADSRGADDNPAHGAHIRCYCQTEEHESGNGENVQHCRDERDEPHDGASGRRVGSAKGIGDLGTVQGEASGDKGGQDEIEQEEQEGDGEKGRNVILGEAMILPGLGGPVEDLAECEACHRVNIR